MQEFVHIISKKDFDSLDQQDRCKKKKRNNKIGKKIERQYILFLTIGLLIILIKLPPLIQVLLHVLLDIKMQQ